MGLALFLPKWWRHSNLRRCPATVDELFEKQKVKRKKSMLIAIVTYAKLGRMKN